MSDGWAVGGSDAWMVCVLCEAVSDDTRHIRPHMWPVRVEHRVDGMEWESGCRCVDHDGCRARVEAKGGSWVVADGTPATPSTEATSENPEPEWSFG